MGPFCYEIGDVIKFKDSDVLSMKGQVGFFGVSGDDVRRMCSQDYVMESLRLWDMKYPYAVWARYICFVIMSCV